MRKTSYHPFRSAPAKAEYHALYMERAKAWPVTSETRLIEISSGQTFVRISGQVNNPSLVLLPGSLGTSLTWIPNIVALSKQYRTYALDSIYDFGLSVRQRDMKTSNDLITWLDEVLRVLMPEGEFDLLGLSYGGWLASLYALHFPERVRKLVLLAPAATVMPVSFTLVFRVLLTLLPFGNFRKHFYYWLLHDALENDDAGRALVDEAVTDWTVAARCFAPLPLIPATVLDNKALQGLPVPCLFMIGEHEKMYSAQKAMERIKRVAPQIKTKIIHHAGHDLSFSQPDLVTGTILDFLNEAKI